ncbi:MAG: hypothetical protein H8D23_23200 [Candidatus Brocadiales bacterium]|nr:hypothetical protein [Candidatus Brocadiales bacterium]
MASRRGYVTTTEVDEMSGLTASTDLQISEAEELIDSYVGAQNKFQKSVIQGKATDGSATSITLASEHQSAAQNDFYKGMEVEIIGGTGIGQRTIITSSTYAGVVSFASLSTAPDSTSIYKIYQLGKFPRQKDVFFDGQNTPQTYYKSIPEAVKRAVAAQVEFMIKMGDAYFQSDKSNMESEKIGDYSYSKGQGSAGGAIKNMIAPKAKILLKGILNRKGIIIF